MSKLLFPSSGDDAPKPVLPPRIVAVVRQAQLWVKAMETIGTREGGGELLGNQVEQFQKLDREFETLKADTNGALVKEMETLRARVQGLTGRN